MSHPESLYLRDPDETDVSTVDVYYVAQPNAFGLTKGIGQDIDSGEIVEWMAPWRLMSKLRELIMEGSETPILVKVCAHDERSRRDPLTTAKERM